MQHFFETRYSIEMRIVVTGANGFLGSWICRILSQYHEVYPFVRHESRIYKLMGGSFREIIYFSEESFDLSVKKVSPDVVVLCDWWGVLNKDRNNYRQFMNVERMRNRIPTLRKVETIIGIGSQAEVGATDKLITEDIMDSPTTKYGKAKVEVRKLLETKLVGDTRFIWGRIFSTYGPLDWDGWFIPSLIRAMLDERPISVTKGEQEWSYLHSYDLAKAIDNIVVDTGIKGIVNIGNPQTVRISSVAQLIVEKFGRPDLIKLGDLPYRRDQVMNLSPLTSKLNQSGWIPQIDLLAGISHLADWMRGENNPILVSNNKSFNFKLPDYDSLK